MSKTPEKIVWHPALCPFCPGNENEHWKADPQCNDCLGYNRDPIPWSELFSGIRKAVSSRRG